MLSVTVCLTVVSVYLNSLDVAMCLEMALYLYLYTLSMIESNKLTCSRVASPYVCCYNR